MRANVKRFCALCLCCVIFVSCVGCVTASAAFLAADILVLVEYFEYLGEFFGDISTEYIDGFADFLVNDTTLGWILPISDDTYYYVNPDDNQLYVSTGGGAGHIAGGERSGGGGRSRDDLYITADMLRAVTADYADRYGPKTTAEYISWRTDSRYVDVEPGSFARLSLFQAGSFCNEDLWTSVYLVPFWDYLGVRYYSPYQLHFYQVVEKDEDGNRLTDDDGKYIIDLYLDYWDMTDDLGSKVETVLLTDELSTYRYIDFYQFGYYDKNVWRFIGYTNLTNYTSKSGAAFSTGIIATINGLNFDTYGVDYCKFALHGFVR